MSNQFNILPQLYYTNEPIFGRVLRTNQSYNIGDFVFQENPIMSIPYHRDLTSSFKSYMYTYSEKLKVKGFNSDVLERIVHAILGSLQFTREKRSDIINYFYFNSQFDSLEYKNILHDIFNKLYNEIKRQLNSRFITEKDNYNCDVNDIQELINLFDIFRLNGACRRNGENLSIFVNFTLMKHSCKPNITEIGDDDDDMKLYAIESIKPGEALTLYYSKIEYILYPTILRQEHIRQARQFWCNCELCVEEDLTSPLKCPTSGCDGYMYFNTRRSSGNANEGWLCRQCQTAFEGCMNDESNINSLIPVILKEHELLKQYLILHLQQYPNVVKQLCSSIFEAEQKAGIIKGIVGENHSLYILYYKSYLSGIHFKIKWDGLLAPIRSILVTVKWITKTLINDEYRKLYGLKDLFATLTILLKDDLLWELHEKLNQTSTITEIIHIFQEHFPINHRLRFLISKHIDQIDRWLLKCCSNCGKLNNNLMKCSRCLKVCYCNKNCQKKDWKRHKIYCVVQPSSIK